MIFPNIPNPAPPPGVYADVPAMEYHAWGAVSSGLIADVATKTPKDVRARLESPNRPLLSAEPFLGTAIHAAHFEPETYADKLFVIEGAKTTHGKVTKKWADAAIENPDLIIVSEPMLEIIKHASKAIEWDDASREAMAEPGLGELSIVWEDEEAGLPMKSRIGWLSIDDRYASVTDLKCMADISHAAMAKAIAARGYWSQLVHYPDSVMAAREFDERFGNIDECGFEWVLTRTKPSWDAACLLPDPKLFDGARQVYRRAVRRLARCYAEDHWPGRTDGGKGSQDVSGWWYYEHGLKNERKQHGGHEVEIGEDQDPF